MKVTLSVPAMSLIFAQWHCRRGKMKGAQCQISFHPYGTSWSRPMQSKKGRTAKSSQSWAAHKVQLAAGLGTIPTGNV